MELTSKQKTVLLENKDVFEQIIKYEEEKATYYKERELKMAWDYGDVKSDGLTLYQFYKAKLLTMPYGSGGKHKNYALVDLPTIKQFLFDSEQDVVECEYSFEEKEIDIEHLFDNIIGYDDIKHIIKLSLRAKKPVHILLEGPPASAKSLFLMDLERLPNSRPILAGLSTKAGIRDILVDKPTYVEIDELDKVDNAGDLTALLSVMSDGRIIITKNNNYSEIKTTTWVFAACNSLNKINAELLSRFKHFKLPKYTPQEYKDIVSKLLVTEENTTQEIANYIAEQVVKYSKDVREAINVARLATTKKDVNEIIQTSGKYV